MVSLRRPVAQLVSWSYSRMARTHPSGWHLRSQEKARSFTLARWLKVPGQRPSPSAQAPSLSQIKKQLVLWNWDGPADPNTGLRVEKRSQFDINQNNSPDNYGQSPSRTLRNASAQYLQGIYVHGKQLVIENLLENQRRMWPKTSSQ